jgi:hypothetical protein
MNGLVLFGAHVWNLTHPDTQLDLGIVAGLAVSLTALTQILVVNYLGVTAPPNKDEN